MTQTSTSAAPGDQPVTDDPILEPGEAPVSRPRLADRIPEGGVSDPDEILDLFLGWVLDIGFELYPAQEEALLEIMAGRHVVLNTPTGSGKSLVALGMHFKALCEGKRSFYTSPIKALASEKFFALCDELGAENVAMLTGDASINSKALVVCCTAEVLSNMALRQGRSLDAPYVIMDEFHYYSDRDRGVAWQVPLVTLPSTKFLLMSATLGDTSSIEEKLEERTRTQVAAVRSVERPVPLDFEYRKTPLHETVQDLLDDGRAPIYIVNFTQRDCAELAQSLVSINPCSKPERQAIRDAIQDFRFDTAYGKEMRRFLTFGIGVHHAGLLPKYRLLVEQLSQQGLLKVIAGTDTLGVGVNIPIRTVLFTKLCKYDGTKDKILSVREFKQIAGRAGRKGFDDHGSVVVQAPEHVIENIRNKRKAAGSGNKKKYKKKQPPTRGYVHWDKKTFERLISNPPETLKSRFRITHGMVVNLLQQDAEVDNLSDNFASLRDLIAHCHEADPVKDRLLSEAALLVRSLYRADVITTVKDTKTAYRWVVVNEDLQWDFSLFHTLALYLVEVLDVLDQESPDYALDLLTVVESILETPYAIVRQQTERAKTDALNQMKADGLHYEERIERLQEITHPQPNADFLYSTFDVFREAHPWVRGAQVNPKSIGREIFEHYMSFGNFVRRYKLKRSEGLVLRYLSQLYKTLAQTVPMNVKTDPIYDMEAYFRSMVERVDNSLLEEWESLIHPELQIQQTEDREANQRKIRYLELLHDEKTFAARVRAELHQLVRELAAGHWEEAAAYVRKPEDMPDPWTPERLEEALAPFLAEYGELVFSPEARRHRHTTIRKTADRTWAVTQVLLDPEGDNLWHLAATIHLPGPEALDQPLLQLERVGT
ncbi:MAG: DUF3516 domain-containing protein [Acidobacteriota bacterium]|nr:DUF3516 domain-containing protein [Acidobacteriota bacterium]